MPVIKDAQLETTKCPQPECRRRLRLLSGKKNPNARYISCDRCDYIQDARERNGVWRVKLKAEIVEMTPLSFDCPTCGKPLAEFVFRWPDSGKERRRVYCSDRACKTKIWAGAGDIAGRCPICKTGLKYTYKRGGYNRSMCTTANCSGEEW